MPKEDTNEKILGKLHLQLQQVVNKLDLLFRLVEQLCQELQEGDDDSCVEGGQSSGVLEFDE